MYIAPVMIADSSEIKSPKYIDLQTVQQTEGRNRFQAVPRSVLFCLPFCSVCFHCTILSTLQKRFLFIISFSFVLFHSSAQL